MMILGCWMCVLRPLFSSLVLLVVTTRHGDAAVTHALKMHLLFTFALASLFEIGELLSLDWIPIGVTWASTVDLLLPLSNFYREDRAG